MEAENSTAHFQREFTVKIRSNSRSAVPPAVAALSDRFPFLICVSLCYRSTSLRNTFCPGKVTMFLG